MLLNAGNCTLRENKTFKYQMLHISNMLEMPNIRKYLKRGEINE